MPRPDPDLVARLRAAGCVFAEDEAALLATAAHGPEREALVRRRIAGEPLEHVLGRVDFDGLRVRITPGVFVPRRRSEALVHAAVAALPDLAPGHRPLAVDLCCGCGALGLAVARRAAADRHGADRHVADSRAADSLAVDLHAADADPVATACAAANLAGIGTVHTGDLFAALPGRLRGRVDVLVANTPYVPSGAIASMPPEARDHEPRAALDGGADGLGPGPPRRRRGGGVARSGRDAADRDRHRTGAGAGRGVHRARPLRPDRYRRRPRRDLGAGSRSPLTGVSGLALLCSPLRITVPAPSGVAQSWSRPRVRDSRCSGGEPGCCHGRAREDPQDRGSAATAGTRATLLGYRDGAMLDAQRALATVNAYVVAGIGARRGG